MMKEQKIRMNQTVVFVRFVSIIAAVVLGGMAPPAMAEHAAQTRFQELVPWLPGGLPAISEVVAFEENGHFVYLAGRLPGSTRQRPGDDGSGPRIRFIFLRPATLVVDLGPFDAKRHDIGEPVSMAELEWPSHAGRKSKRVVCVYRSPGEQTKLSMEAKVADDDGSDFTIQTANRRFHLTLPPKLDKPARIAIASSEGQTLLAERRLPDGVLPFGPNGAPLLETWDARYRGSSPPRWDKGVPSSHLIALVESGQVKPGRAVVLGCGTGTNAIYLAEKGFEVTAIDVAPTALNLAEEKARVENVKVRWLLADVLAPPAGLAPFDFAFDRGCYHHVRSSNAREYVEAAKQWSRPGTQILILSSYAIEEPRRRVRGVKEEDLRGDFSTDFTFIRLDTVRFDSTNPNKKGGLAWLALLRRVADEQP